jgi:hypothetical protein
MMKEEKSKSLLGQEGRGERGERDRSGERGGDRGADRGEAPRPAETRTPVAS